MAKKRYFAIVAHCLLNPSTRVHMLGRRFCIAEKVSDYFLSKHISIIQLPCPEFTAMGYWRNPQGRQQYDNTFFRKHCKKELETYVDMIIELVKNDNTPFCFMGIQGSPTCSIYWGKHKTNRYKTESMEEDIYENIEEGARNDDTVHSRDKDKNTNINSNINEIDSSMYGVMTQVLDEMLKENGINMPYVEAPVKESLESKRAQEFFCKLDEILGIPEKYRGKNITENNIDSLELN